MNQSRRLASLLLAFVLVVARPCETIAQAVVGPDTVAVNSGLLTLHGLLWRPSGVGTFPGVLFNHGSSGTADPMSMEQASTLGPLFARHGYVFFLLFRQGIGLSRGQGTADGDLMARALAAGSVQGKNRVQLKLLEGEELDEVVAGLAVLRALPKVDPKRIAVVGHSFGGSLTLLLVARDTTVRAAVAFAPAAASWAQSPQLRARLLAAVDRAVVPVMFIHAANDYSVAPGQALAAEMKRRGKPHALEIYPAVGGTARDGHNLVYLKVSEWERDVFRFLDERLRRN